MKSSHVIDIVQPVTLLTGDEEPGENQILMGRRILIQLQKLLYIPFSCIGHCNFLCVSDIISANTCTSPHIITHAASIDPSGDQQTGYSFTVTCDQFYSPTQGGTGNMICHLDGSWLNEPSCQRMWYNSFNVDLWYCMASLGIKDRTDQHLCYYPNKKGLRKVSQFFFHLFSLA